MYGFSVFASGNTIILGVEICYICAGIMVRYLNVMWFVVGVEWRWFAKK